MDEVRTCEYCKSPAQVSVEHRTGTGTRKYCTCLEHAPQKGVGALPGVPAFKYRAMGEWGMLLRRMAGI